MLSRKPVLAVGTWIHLILRIPLFLCGVTLLALAIYMAVRWGPVRHQKIYPAVLAEAVLSMLTDISAIILLTTKLSYIPTIAFFDTATLFAGIWGVVTILFSDYSYGDAPEGSPTGWQHIDGITLAFALTVVCLRVISMIILCIGCCKNQREKKKGGRENPTAGTGKDTS
ncbi:hypothetical protein BDV59DRAFT_188483 [Aspergillus ambiguus]|uniref:uncharacterized protein n=1 Tax=Aspergillus ambiguus TaxID=176160 RepID=UPI003CCD5ACA